MDLSLGNISAVILAIGALGAAAFGVIEAFGKSVASSSWRIIDHDTGEIAADRRLLSFGTRFRGLPFVGFSAVQEFMRALAPALIAAYGRDYQKVVLRQYRNGRGGGEAPGTIRQGVRLGLQMITPEQTSYMVAQIWGAPEGAAPRLAAAISARNQRLGQVGAGSGDVPPDEAEALLASFITALDARLDAAFAVAEERYVAAARGWAAVAALGLALGLNYIAAVTPPAGDTLPWGVAALVGLVAVPLAPVSKDLAKAVADAVGAFRVLRTGR